MATIGSAKATLVNKIDSLTASATAKDTIYLAKALKENTNHHSFTFQGAWAATTAYALDDVVTNGGNTYICIAAHTSGASFSVGSNWSLMAGAGTDGTDGADGTDGTDVGTGTAGQVLTTNSGATGTEWADASEGAILQVKHVLDATSRSNQVDSWSSTGGWNWPEMAFTFTPTDTSSRIMIQYSFAIHHASAHEGVGWITWQHAGRGESAIYKGNDGADGVTFRAVHGTNTSSDMMPPINGHFMFHPNTTDEITFRVRLTSTDSSHPWYMHRSVNGSTLGEDGGSTFSTLTATEISNSISPVIIKDNDVQENA